MHLVPEMYKKYESDLEDGTSPAAWQELMKAAGTMLIGKDGRLLDHRRGRRQRLGARSGQVARVDGFLRLEQRRFQTLDKEYVAEKLLGIQWEAASGGFPLKW